MYCAVYCAVCCAVLCWAGLRIVSRSDGMGYVDGREAGLGVIDRRMGACGYALRYPSDPSDSLQIP
jgi:hypothetical protein